jgi:hypothetical protein
MFLVMVLIFFFVLPPNSMAIEDDNIRDREVWTGVSRHWYQRASDRAPTTGRLYHHLAILARPDAIQQIFYYVKSLCVAIPFVSARDSILTLLDPVLNGQNNRLVAFDQSFVLMHAILFTKKQSDKFPAVRTSYVGLLDNHIMRMSRKWLDAGVYVSIGISCALLEYGVETSYLLSLVKQSSGTEESTDAKELEPSQEFHYSVSMATRTDRIVYARLGDNNVLPHIYCNLVFIYWLAPHSRTWDAYLSQYPWQELVKHLNYLLDSFKRRDRMLADAFPVDAAGESKPLPEEWNLRGSMFAEDFFPPDHFSNDKRDDEEKYLQAASMMEDRKEKILWISHKIARLNRCLVFDEVKNMFRTAPDFENTSTTDDIELPDADM